MKQKILINLGTLSFLPKTADDLLNRYTVFNLEILKTEKMLENIKPKNNEIMSKEDLRYTFKIKKGQKCTEKNCNELAVIDYNGFEAWACQRHYDRWTNEFEEDYR